MRRATVFLCATFATLGLSPLTTKSVAGNYTSTDCAFWNGYSNAQYSASASIGVAYRDCSSGGNGLVVTIPIGGGHMTVGNWTISTPPGTHFTNLSFFQRGAWDPGNGWDIANYVIGTDDSWNGLGTWKDGAGAWRGIGATPGSYKQVGTMVYCGLGGGCAGSLVAGILSRDYIFNMVDDAAPAVSDSGELVNGDVQRGAAGLELSADDVGAGLSQVYVVVNDQVVSAQSLTCAGPGMQPCPSATPQPLRFDLDTEQTPFHNGLNAVQACAADYGTPSNVSCAAKRLVRVDNSCTPSPVPGGSRLSAVFSKSRRDVVQVKAGKGARLVGRLRDSFGDPVVNATLCTREVVAGRRRGAVGTVTTNARGRYRYAVSPGPNRRLKVGYRHNREQIERRAHFKSRLRPRLKLWPKQRTENGKRLRLYGSIAGPRNNGRIVILQASDIQSGSWLTFRRARTNRLGNFRASYRFTATDTTTMYRFRAVAPVQNGYPYEGGASRAKRITVVGG